MTFRIQAGLFNLRRGTYCPISKICLMLFMLSTGLMTWICLLLMLSGDIEPNPGLGVIKGILLNARSIKFVNSRRNKLAELQSLCDCLSHGDMAIRWYILWRDPTIRSLQQLPQRPRGIRWYTWNYYTIVVSGYTDSESQFCKFAIESRFNTPNRNPQWNISRRNSISEITETGTD